MSKEWEASDLDVGSLVVMADSDPEDCEAEVVLSVYDDNTFFAIDSMGTVMEYSVSDIVDVVGRIDIGEELDSISNKITKF